MNGVDSMIDSSTTEEDFYGLTQVLEQTIVLVDQAAHSITYHRWMEILNEKWRTHKHRWQMLCLRGGSKEIWGKKTKEDQCEKIDLELRQIISRNNPLSQTPRSTRRLGDDQMSIKKDSITRSQWVTSQVRSSTFIRKKPSFQSNRKSEIYTVWKVSKCGVISGPYFPVFGAVFGHFSRSARKQAHKKFSTCLSSSKGTVHQDSGGYISFWTDKAFFLQLEKYDKWQKHSEHGQGIRTKFFTRTSSEQVSEKHEYV